MAVRASSQFNNARLGVGLVPSVITGAAPGIGKP